MSYSQSCAPAVCRAASGEHASMRMLRTIYFNLGRIFEIAKRDNIPTYKAADRMAEERINAIGKLRLPHLGATAPRFQGRSGR